LVILAANRNRVEIMERGLGEDSRANVAKKNKNKNNNAGLECNITHILLAFRLLNKVTYSSQKNQQRQLHA
jgi:hypothetical protein